MQDKQEFEVKAGIDELDSDLEASLRNCQHMVAEYRAMLIAAYRADPLTDGKEESA